MRALVLGLVTVVACNRGPAPATVAVIGASAPGVARDSGLFDGLFAGDRVAVYDVTRVSSYRDERDSAADADGMVETEVTQVVTCELDVETVGRYRVLSRVCDPPIRGVFSDALVAGLEGRFITDGQALWFADVARLDTVEDIEPHLGAPVLTLDQLPVREVRPLPDGPDYNVRREVVAADDGWCVSDVLEVTFTGEEDATRWCVSAAAGITRATWSFDGGWARDERAELRR